MFVKISSPLVTYRIVDLLPFRELICIDRGANVKAGSSDEKGLLSAAINIGEAFSCIVLKYSRRVCIAWIDQVKTKMGNKTLRLGKFSGADVHAAIDLHGVSTYHFPIEFARKELCYVGFP